MVITNDVFGLTISQFERMYKACLERRKIHEQYILNLRYPDKSSKEYLEYLENCTDCIKDHLRWIDPRDKCLYEHLVQIVGSEIDIRTRQRLFIINDMIIKASGFPSRTHIFSGSLAEGLDLPGSDMDVMYVMNNYKVIHNVENIKNQIHSTTFFVMETDINHPGFAKLRHVRKESLHNEVYPRKQCSYCPPGTCTGSRSYLSVNRFLNRVKDRYPDMEVIIHGPCISDKAQTDDIAFCIRSKYLPHNSIPWASRHRLQWPPSFVIDRIMKYGCLFVPIGPKTMPDNDFLWRVSFSVAEKILVHSFTYTKLLCYGLLKLTLKYIVNRNIEGKDLLCSYFLKTALFWVSEEVDIDTFQISKIYYCFSLCLDKLKAWVHTCYCPNYFIPEHNIFQGKIDQSNNKILLGVLENIKCRGVNGLTENLFTLDNAHQYLSSTKSRSSFILLDFLLYRTTCYVISKIREGKDFYKALSCIDSLQKSESSIFIFDACKSYRDRISEKMAQMLPPPNTIAQHVHYGQHSSLIPEELRLEVEFSEMNILPNVMSRCLRFLCYHHLGDISNRRQSLRDLYITVKENDVRSLNTESNELTILGVCFDISGDKDIAYQCYEEALQCDMDVCPSAHARISKLLEI
ncbi:Hypothetical predicted protein [Mytilus galloprovincialis]|uniref:Mab-21-like HhH/H2TH-like domain-containing protein n=1 Tax=Mytilus galloprovincialis TaxID=29158 RepID=A0A8B6EBC4_MYTGA|nr:Hypothetical predicted protein [Mytilus galloprovincialis]